MIYMNLLKESFEAGLDVEFLDDAQKNTSNYQEFEMVVRDKLNKSASKPLALPKKEKAENSFEIKVLKEDNTSLKALLDSHMKELTQLRIDFMDLQKESFLYHKSSIHLETEVNSLRKDNQHLSTQKRLSDKKIQSVQSFCDSLKKMNEELSASLRAMESASSSVSEEMYHTLENEFSVIKGRYDETVEKLNFTEKELSSLRNEKSSLEKKYQALVIENQETQLRCKELFENLEKERKKNKPVSGQSFDFSAEAPSDAEIARFETPSDDYTDSFINEMNEELHRNTVAIMDEAEDEDDIDPSAIISMESDHDEIKTHRSFFRRLIDQFKDREFNHLPVHEQTGRIFTKMVERDFPKDTIKIVSDTLKANKKMKRVELYRLVARDASPDECERYCRQIGAA